MNAKEAVKLCLMAKSACPAMALEEDTPVMWGMLLDDIRYVDALAGLVALAKTQPFVSPAEIRAEVKKIRHARLVAFGHLPAPPLEVEQAGPEAYQAWMRDCQRRIADGDVTSPAQLPQRPTGNRSLGDVAGVFRELTAGPPITDEERAPFTEEREERDDQEGDSPAVVTGQVVSS